MRKVNMLLGFVFLGFSLLVSGCNQPRMQQTEVKTKPKQEKVEKVSSKTQQVQAPAKEKELTGEELYTAHIKPLTPAECGRCHVSIYKMLAKEGGKHRFECTNCHEVFHVFRAAQVWNKIVPKCVRCHGYIHGESPALKNCQICHVEAHAPLKIPVGPNLDNNCGKCHPKIIAEMKKFPSEHSKRKCSFCHSKKHGYIPSCMECHEPHISSLTTNKQCLECHPVHSPTQPMVFKPDTSGEICSACHSEEVEKLAANKSKHHDVACVECHTKHAYIPKCQECHDQPHSAALLKRFPNCLACHIDPHDLPIKSNMPGGKSK